MICIGGPLDGKDAAYQSCTLIAHLTPPKTRPECELVPRTTEYHHQVLLVRGESIDVWMWEGQAGGRPSDILVELTGHWPNWGITKDEFDVQTDWDRDYAGARIMRAAGQEMSRYVDDMILRSIHNAGV